VLQFLIKQHANLGKIEKQIVDNMMIEKLIAYFDGYKRGDAFAHYAGQFAMLGTGAVNQAKPFSKTKDHISRLFSGKLRP
jgi:hypothetical protein